MEIVLGWFVFSIVAGIAASARNRSVVGWFFAALLFSPLICLIILAFLPKIPDNDSASANTQEARHGVRPCPFCAEDIKLAAVVCRHCGRDVVPAPISASAPKKTFIAKLRTAGLPDETPASSGVPDLPPLQSYNESGKWRT